MGKLAHVQAALNKPKLVQQSAEASKVHETDLVARIAERVAAMIQPSTHTVERVPVDIGRDIESVIRQELAGLTSSVTERVEIVEKKKTDWVFTVERDADGFIETITAK
jgi:hypothetical protein